MLLCSNLISDIRNIFYYVGSWNMFPTAYPYILETFVGNTNALPYQVSVNKKFLDHNWIIHEIFFLLAILFGITRIYFDCHTIFEKVTVWFFIYFALEYFVLTWFHKNTCYLLACFMNQLISFEIKNVSSHAVKREREFWKNDRTRLVVSVVSKVFNFALLNHSVCYSLSCAVFPNKSWNIVPSVVMNAISDSSLMQFIVKRVAMWYYLYVTMRVYTNLACLCVMVNLLIPTFCLSGSMRFLQR